MAAQKPTACGRVLALGDVLLVRQGPVDVDVALDESDGFGLEVDFQFLCEFQVLLAIV